MMLAATAGAADSQPVDAATAKFFETEVQPILKETCFKCHGGEAKIKGGLRLTSRAGVLKGGDTSSAIDLKKPDDSLLLKMLTYSDDDHQMPPKGKLPQAKIDVLTKWVKLGAPWSGAEAAAPEPVATGKPEARGGVVDDEARHYWCYQKVQRPTAPSVKDAAWPTSPLDAFVLAKVEAQGLKPAKPAERAALIRRATYDLIGLPPSPEEVEAFVKDADPKAYDKLLDRLLASPQYGEKWGRHWLDLVGYAETNGYERDGNKPHAWRYRDYVIKSFNDDKPYDRFLTEQLAGDELDQPTAETLTATGYYRLGLWDDEPADPEQARMDGLDTIVSTTAGSMLGMAMGCARCHDHKRDPFPQSDYYRLLAFFHATTPMGNNGPNVERVIRHDEEGTRKHDERVAAVQTQLDAIEKEFAAKLSATDPQALGRDLEDLRYRYYRSHWTTLPKFDDIKPETEGELAAGRFDTSLTTRETDYGFVFSGNLVVPQDGEYTFILDSDDGSRLTVDGKMLVEYDGIHGTGTPKTIKAKLGRGRHPIRLDYFQAVGGFGLLVRWSGPGVPERSLTPDDKGPKVPDLLAARGEAVLGKERFKNYQALRKELADVKRQPTGDELALIVTEMSPPDTFVLPRGNPRNHGKQVQPGFPEVLGFADPVIKAPAAGAKTGARSTALAKWITDPANPLTARVMANRLWLHHFGRGIVPTPNDWGKLGEQPTNQPLLDWIAAEFVAGGWKIKAMHKLLMTSSAYRMSVQDDPAASTKDPENRSQWRFAMRRLTAEEIRDSILTVDGTLNPAMGGPSIFPPMPKEVLATSSTPDSVWGKSTPEEAARRSVYIKVKRSLAYPMLSLHDVADTDASCPARFATTVPTQALTMLNSDFIAEQAALFARRLSRDVPSDTAKQVRRALQLVCQRPPSDAEVRRGTGFIADLQAKDGASAERALQLFCLLALNLNEFVYLD